MLAQEREYEFDEEDNSLPSSSSTTEYQDPDPRNSRGEEGLDLSAPSDHMSMEGRSVATTTSDNLAGENLG